MQREPMKRRQIERNLRKKQILGRHLVPSARKERQSIFMRLIGQVFLKFCSSLQDKQRLCYHFDVIRHLRMDFPESRVSSSEWFSKRKLSSPLSEIIMTKISNGKLPFVYIKTATFRFSPDFM